MSNDLCAYVFTDDAGLIADIEVMTPSEADLRNLWAAAGQALRWRRQTEVICELLGSCTDQLQRLKASPQPSRPRAP